MSELEIVTAVVISHLTSGLGDLAAAPLKGLARDLEDRVRSRMARIGKAAEVKADGRPIEADDRVLFKVLTEGGYTDDEVIADYLGGVLAASGPDDGAAAIVAQIGRLSGSQLRLHFVIYREIRRLWPSDRPLSVTDGTEARKATVRLDGDEVAFALGTEEADVVGSALTALNREDLIRDYSLKHDDGKWRLEATPTAPGAELFMWGHGIRPPSPSLLTNDRVVMRFLADIPQTPSSTLVNTPA